MLSDRRVCNLSAMKPKIKKAKMKKVTKGSVGFSLDSLPLDLIVEIFKLVPIKTITRLLSVSKLWASIIRNRDIMKLFVSESLNRPRGLVLLSACGDEDLALFDTLEASSSIDSLPTYHVTYNKRQDTFMAPSVHDLICYGFDSRLGIYNITLALDGPLPYPSSIQRVQT
ncbi:unnamed protein product [Thlaspi arvense]|uniref:F-box domain-containing protein n=1 Tax=Thlaspi arvense TaxID=13288 RepID=A0AAU9R714_THLAR|nr:unnamed protein product [Thlaspi arvense]